MTNDLSKEMRYRDHRGTLAESMDTLVVLERSMDALVAHLNIVHSHAPMFLDDPGRHITADDLEFHRAGYDTRVQWNTVWVRLKGFGVLGCIDGTIEGVETGDAEHLLLKYARYARSVPPDQIPLSKDEWYTKFVEGLNT